MAVTAKQQAVLDLVPTGGDGRSVRSIWDELDNSDYRAPVRSQAEVRSHLRALHRKGLVWRTGSVNPIGWVRSP